MRKGCWYRGRSSWSRGSRRFASLIRLVLVVAQVAHPGVDVFCGRKCGCAANVFFEGIAGFADGQHDGAAVFDRELNAVAELDAKAAADLDGEGDLVLVARTLRTVGVWSVTAMGTSFLYLPDLPAFLTSVPYHASLPFDFTMRGSPDGPVGRLAGYNSGNPD
jgi:hypothetical protein